MASKKKTFAAKRSNLPKRKTVKRKRKPNARQIEPLNPNPAADMVEASKEVMDFVVPAFVTYAAGRFAQRVAYQIGLRRFGGNTKFAHLAAVASNVAIAYGIYKADQKEVPVVSGKHLPLQVGNGIAMTQYAVQRIPKYGWIVSDFDEKQAAAKALPKKDGEEDEIDLDSLEGDDDYNADYGIGEGIGMGAGIGAGAGALPPGKGDDMDLEAELGLFGSNEDSNMGSLG